MVNRENYLLVKKHLLYLEEIAQLSRDSITRYWFYLRHALLWADETPFGRANKIRPSFPSYVCTVQSGRGGRLSATSQKKIVETTKRLFARAKASYPNAFSNLPNSWIDTLRPPRLPQQGGEHIYVTSEEVLKLVSVPCDPKDIARKRDQAAAAMLFLSGMRASAFSTLPLSAVCLPVRSIRQWPELGVKTKNGKRATTY
jgi:site-specific recombinase XerD